MESHELRLLINANAARAGGKAFVAAIRQVQAAVSSLDRDSSGGFTKLRDHANQAAKAARGAASQIAAANKQVSNSGKGVTDTTKNQTTATQRAQALQLQLAAAMRTTATESARLRGQLLRTGDAKGVQDLTAAYERFRSQTSGGVSSTLALRGAVSQFANETNRLRVSLINNATAAQREAAAKKMAAQASRDASSAARRLEADIRSNAASANAASQAFRNAAGGLRGMENAFNLSFQAASAFRTMIGSITLGSFTQNVFRAGDALDQFRITMEVASGSTQAAASDLVFIDDLARRLGTNLSGARDAFSKFAVSANIAGVSTEQTRGIFESVSTAMAVLGRGTEDQQLAFLALEQMMSKGVISAEELRRQLGERLPGAVNLMARAVGVTTAELQDMLKAGELISSEVLPLFAQELNSVFGPQIERTFNRAGSNLGRLQVEFQKFLETIAESGFLDSLSRQFRDLTSIMRSADMQGFAENLGRGFADAADAIGSAATFIARNIEQIGEIAHTIFTVMIVTAIGRAAAAMLLFGQRAAGTLASLAALRGGATAAAAGTATFTAQQTAAGVVLTQNTARATGAAAAFSRFGSILGVAARGLSLLTGVGGIVVTALSFLPLFFDDTAQTVEEASLTYQESMRRMGDSSFSFLDQAMELGNTSVFDDITSNISDIIQAQQLLGQFQADSSVGSAINAVFADIDDLTVSTTVRDMLTALEAEVNAFRLSDEPFDQLEDRVDEIKRQMETLRGLTGGNDQVWDQLRRLEDVLLPAAQVLKQMSSDISQVTMVAGDLTGEALELTAAAATAEAEFRALKDGIEAAGNVPVSPELREFLENGAGSMAAQVEEIRNAIGNVTSYSTLPEMNVQFAELSRRLDDGEIGVEEFGDALAGMRQEVLDYAGAADESEINTSSLVGWLLEAINAGRAHADAMGEAKVSMDQAAAAAAAAQAPVLGAADAADQAAAAGRNGAAGIMSLANAFATLAGAGSVAIGAIGERVEEVNRQIELRRMNFVDRAVATESDRIARDFEAGLTAINDDLSAAIQGQPDGAANALRALAQERRQALMDGRDQLLAATRELATTPLNNEGRPGSTGSRRSSSGGRSGGASARSEEARALEDLNNRMDQYLTGLRDETEVLQLVTSGRASSAEAAQLLIDAQRLGVITTDEQSDAFLNQAAAAERLRDAMTMLAEDPVNAWVNSVPSWLEAGRMIEEEAIKKLSSSLAEFLKNGEFSLREFGQHLVGMAIDIVSEKAVKSLLGLLGGNMTGEGEGGFGLGGFLGDLLGGVDDSGPTSVFGGAEGAEAAAIQAAMSTGGTQAAAAIQQAFVAGAQQVGMGIQQGTMQGGIQMQQQVQLGHQMGGVQVGARVRSAHAQGGTQVGIRSRLAHQQGAQRLSQGVVQGSRQGAPILAQGVKSGAAGGGMGGGGFLGTLLSFLPFAEGGLSSAPTSANTPVMAPASLMRNAPQFKQGTTNTSGIPAMLHDNEAVIPLSKGRKIPVEMNGADGGGQRPTVINQNINIQTPNVREFNNSRTQIGSNLRRASAQGERND